MPWNRGLWRRLGRGADACRRRAPYPQYEDPVQPRPRAGDECVSMDLAALREWLDKRAGTRCVMIAPVTQFIPTRRAAISPPAP